MKQVLASGAGYENGIMWRKSWSYNLVQTDSGRSVSRRPKQSNDCTVRALANVFDMDYDDAYDYLAAAGRKCSRGFHFKTLEHPKLKWEAYQAIKGQSRKTISDFCKEHPEGKWIIRVSKHVAAVIDGVVYDTFESNPTKCVYGAWKVAE